MILKTSRAVSFQSWLIIPAQKWLKDLKRRELSFDNILHYQKIIVALTVTDRIMKELDQIEIE